ncbi:MAG: hypothetical protein Q7R43_04265 [Candidatus Daviesbacteria bacterium]|nr:hypothetical protein [Candidatus Daviesbacteria bacterium]
MNSKERFGTLLKVRAGLGGWPLGTPVPDSRLRVYQMSEIMVDVGRDLAKLHVKQGEGYGPVDNRETFVFGRFKAHYRTWPEYLTDRFQKQGDHLEKVIDKEVENGTYLSGLSAEQKIQHDVNLEKRPFVSDLMKKFYPILLPVKPHLLHGNIHKDIIFTKEEKYAGLGDYSQMVLGDPVNDLAYASIMPDGDEWKMKILQGWGETQNDPDLEKKMHLYRLLESYRKIYTRYVKHHWLGAYPQPFDIAQQEISHLVSS